MSLVLDASATLAWIYREGAPGELDRLYEAVQAEGASVPQLWRLEVVNVLLVNVRKGRHSLQFVNLQLMDLRRLVITVDALTQDQAWEETMRQAIKHNLTIYDAAYLELAHRLRLPLATLDKALIRAAQAESIPLFWN